MDYAIIDSYSVKEFLQQEGAELIYNSVNDEITSCFCIEVWLKGSSLISLKIEPKSNLLISVNLYTECVPRSFSFYDHKLDEFQAFCNEVQPIDATPTDSITVSDWKDLLKIFSVGKDYETDLENANALINAFQKVYPDYVAKFDPIRCELQELISNAFNVDSPFQPGDLLYKPGSELYRYIGEMDDCGNRLFSGGITNDCNFKDPAEFKDFQKVDSVPFFEETVKGFSDIFDADFIKAIAGIINSNCKNIALEDYSVEQICEPFRDLVEQKYPIKIENRGSMGFHYSIDVAPKFVVEGSFSSSLASVSIHKQEDHLSNEEFINGTLNPLFIREDNSVKSALNCVLDFLSSLYQTFSYEIAELGLMDSFIDLYGMWHQLYSEINCDYDYGKTIYQELYQALASKELQQNTDTKAQPVDAFSSDSFSSSPFGKQKKTVIEVNDTLVDAIMKMSEGVPGTVVALTSFMNHPELVKPADPLFEILALDSAGLYGSELYTLFTYCCENSIKNYRLVSLNRSHGNLSVSTIQEFTKESKSFFRNRDAAGMEEFADWTAFEDCYSEKDSYFDPGKGSYCTWPYSWDGIIEEDLVAIKITEENSSNSMLGVQSVQGLFSSFLGTATEDNTVSNDFTDTKNGMPWEAFFDLTLDQDFKIAYENSFEDDSDNDRHECIMYREDGLILYANSFWGGLNHVTISGEVSAAIQDLAPLSLGNGYRSKNGSYVFRKDVRDGMIVFLDSLEEDGVLLLPVWTEKRVVLDILTEKEWNSTKSSNCTADEIMMKKLSHCCEDAKRIMAPYFEDTVVPKQSSIQTKSPQPKSQLKNLFNKLKR